MSKLGNRSVPGKSRFGNGRLSACMQVMKSLLDSIDRQERIDLKQQRKQETYDERLKRTSQHRFESLLLKHKDNLRKDILKKRNALEREIATEIHVRVTRSVARRFFSDSAFSYGVLINLENLEITGNLLFLENSGNLKCTRGILLIIRSHFFEMQFEHTTRQAGNLTFSRKKSTADRKYGERC